MTTDEADEAPEGLDEEEEELPGDEAPPLPNGGTVTPIAQPGTSRSSKRRQRVGVGAHGKAPLWQESDAELLWGEMLQYMSDAGDDRMTPYKLTVQVVVVDPGPARKLGDFPAQRIMGDDTHSPGDVLHNIVVNEYHLPSQHGPADYDIRFVWTKNTRLFGRGKLHLGSPEEINNLRIAANRARAQHPPPPGTFAGTPEPTGFAPPAPRGAAPAAAASSSPEMREVLAQMAEVRRQNDWLMGQVLDQARREGRAPPVPPPASGTAAPPAQPTPAMPDIGAVERAVAKGIEAGVGVIVEKLGLGSKVAQVSSVPSTADKLRQTTDEIVGGIIESALGMVSDTVKKSVKAGFGAPQPAANPAPQEPDDDEPEDPPEPPPPPPEPGDGLPFQVDQVPKATWADGRPVQFARNKETGDIDWKGSAFANPFVVEKVGEFANKFAEGFEGVMKRWADGMRPPGQHLPGTGAPPQQRQQPQQQQPAPAQQEPKKPEGGSEGGGWPTV